MADVKMIPNRPTPEGRMLGEHLARLTEGSAKKIIAELIENDSLDLMPQPCRSCAFRRGKFPNGCPETVMDALKCTMEGVPFYCHEIKPGKSRDAPKPLCHGYLIARLSLRDRAPLPTPWPFSEAAALPEDLR